MASPQKENGYTPVANEILEEITKIKLNATQLRILLILWRYTYGFSRKDHELSETFIAKAIRTNKAHAHKEINNLIKMNIVLVEKDSTYSKPRSLSFNKDYERWSATAYQECYSIPGTPQHTESGTPQHTTGGVLQQSQDKQKAKSKKVKKTYMENVLLTDDQYLFITQKYGEKGRDRIIELLSTYKLSSGKKYKDDFAAMRNWVYARYEKEVNFDSAETKRPEPLEMSEDDYEIQVIKC